MKRLATGNWQLATLLSVALCLCGTFAFAGETPAPQKVPVAVWFQPARNVPMCASLGIDTFFGPCVENDKALTPDQLRAGQEAWARAVIAVGGKMVLKDWRGGALPAGTIGVCLSVDEPNGKGWTAAQLKAESDSLRIKYPGVPIFLSLAGDKITSANLVKPEELAAMRSWGSIADVLTVNCYSANRNASRYPMTWTADAVRRLAGATGRPVWAWVEMNDQVVLPAPKPADGISRAPTPQEVDDTVGFALAAGAAGIGWFATSQSNAYGWGVKDPARGDSFWPLVDRNGASMAAQIAAVKTISFEIRKAGETPAPQVTLADVILMVNEQSRQIALLRAQVERQSAILEGVFRVPATQESK